MDTINGIKPVGNPYEVISLHGGIICYYYFDNGYGASVVQHRYSYGGPEGLWELAVLAHTSGGKYVTSYETPITDDVMGRLTSAEVEALLEQIAELPSRL